MKRIIFIILVTTLTSPIFSQKASKVNEYLNEPKEEVAISVSRDQIRSKKTPGVNFSIEGKRGVNQEFLNDEFVKSVVSDNGSGVKIGQDGDMEFEPSKEKVNYSDSLKDESQYSDEEIAYWAGVSNQYYQFKDFDAYEDFYYYYDQSVLENNKISKSDDVKKASVSLFSYIAKAISSLIPPSITLKCIFIF